MANEQVNVPSLVVILVLSGLIIRYLFFTSPTPHQQQQQQPRDSVSASRSREAAVERIQQMFPQVDRRTVLWDLQRNGGNITLTTERILAGRLEVPPVTFQPPPPTTSTTAVSSTAQTSSQSQQAARPADSAKKSKTLIDLYGLYEQVAMDEATAPSFEGGDSESTTTTDGKGGNGKRWKSTREEREAILQRTRDQMILEARRKMEAKMAAEKAAAAAGTGGS